MKQTISHLQQGFETSTGTTEQFKEFTKTLKTELTSEFNKINAELVSYKIGHFHVYGLIKLETGKKVYFSTPDVRLWDSESPSYFGKFLFREVFKEGKEFQDTTGKNNYVSVYSGMASEVKKLID